MSRRDLSFTPFSSERPESSRGRDRDRAEIPVSLIIDNSCRVYITQIPLERIERDGANALRAEFEAFGPVESYKMFTERSGRFIGSVLCTYRNPADASMAVHRMNGQVVGGGVLKVTLSRDHGVVLLHPGGKRHRGFLHDTEADAEAEEGKWEHDRYEAILRGAPLPAEAEPPNHYNTHNHYNSNHYNSNHYNTGLTRSRAQRGRGGGRGGRGARMDAVEFAFERYVAARDAGRCDANETMETEKMETETAEMEVVEMKEAEGAVTGVAPMPLGSNEAEE